MHAFSRLQLAHRRRNVIEKICRRQTNGSWHWVRKINQGDFHRRWRTRWGRKPSLVNSVAHRIQPRLGRTDGLQTKKLGPAGYIQLETTSAYHCDAKTIMHVGYEEWWTEAKAWMRPSRTGAAIWPFSAAGKLTSLRTMTTSDIVEWWWRYACRLSDRPLRRQ